MNIADCIRHYGLFYSHFVRKLGNEIGYLIHVMLLMTVVLL